MASSIDVLITKLNNYIGFMGFMGIGIAFLLCFAVFLLDYLSFAAKKKIKDETRLKEEIEPRINNSVTDEGPISQGRAAGDPEIIIVGAGVAGAALACSLGKVDIPSSFVALVLKNCQLPYPNHGHVILANPSPILMYPISSFETRCLVDIPGRQKVPSIPTGEMAQYLKTVVLPQLPSEVHGAFISAIEEGDIKVATNRSMPATPCSTPGAILLGDAFNMRHPLTGGGMTVALSDIVVLRKLLKPLDDLNDAAGLNEYLEVFYSLRKPVASTINTLAGALYKVFTASDDQARAELRQACFDYLSLGGVFSNGPVALLSGLNPKPLTLVMHFFAVAIYGVGRLLLPFPSLKRALIGGKLIMDATGIIFPIVKAEGIKQMVFPVSIDSIL